MKRLVEASAESTKHYVQEALKGVEMTSKASAEVVRESAQIVVQDFNESAADRVNTFAKHVESLGQSIETFHSNYPKHVNRLTFSSLPHTDSAIR